MPLYYFHLLDGTDVLLDPEGRELASDDAARLAALKEARSLIAQDALNGDINLAQRLEIFDQSGALIHTVAFRDAVSIRQ